MKHVLLPSVYVASHPTQQDEKLHRSTQRLSKNTSTTTSALKKEEVSREVATFNMGHILDCANVMCFDDNSKSFEEAVKSADEPEEIIALFNQVTLRKL